MSTKANSLHAFVPPTVSIAIKTPNNTFVHSKFPTHSRRRTAAHVVQCKLSGKRRNEIKNNNSQNPSNNAYKQFSDLLDKSSSGEQADAGSSSDNQQKKEQQQQDYANFEEKIGMSQETEKERETRLKEQYELFAQRLNVDGSGSGSDSQKPQTANSPTSPSGLSNENKDYEAFDQAIEIQRESEAEKKRTTKIQYEEFAKRLGFEESSSSSRKKPQKPLTEEQPETQEQQENPRQGLESQTKSPQPTSPDLPVQKSPISQADYSKFDTLLSRTGGSKGRKPMKGSKRWVGADEFSKSTSRRDSDTGGEDKNGDDFNESEVKDSSFQKPPARSSSTKFSSSDAAEGYALLQDAFGSGFHRSASPPSPPTNAQKGSTESKEDMPKLNRPPPRPSDISASEVTPAVPKYIYDKDVAIPSAEVGPLPPLQPKPSMPQQNEDVAKANKDSVENSRSSDNVIAKKSQIKLSKDDQKFTPVLPTPKLESKPERPVKKPSLQSPSSAEARIDGSPTSTSSDILQENQSKENTKGTDELESSTANYNVISIESSFEKLGEHFSPPINLQGKPLRPGSIPALDDSLSDSDLKVENEASVGDDGDVFQEASIINESDGDELFDGDDCSNTRDGSLNYVVHDIESQGLDFENFTTHGREAPTRPALDLNENSSSLLRKPARADHSPSSASPKDSRKSSQSKRRLGRFDMKERWDAVEAFLLENPKLISDLKVNYK